MTTKAGGARPLEILRLTLHRRYFAEILSGKKKKEYRRLCDYWRARLEDRHFDVIRFRNGYAKAAPEMDVEFKGLKVVDDEYVISLGRILSVKNWR